MDPVEQIPWACLEGDCLSALKTLGSESVHCCVTSPPYWGLRDYGHAGQIGLEATPEAYVVRMVEVFREVRRVLRDDGTLWLNLGDSYNAYNGNRGASTSFQAATEAALPDLPSGFGLTCKSLKPKDLVGIPWRVAFALQADGWWLRQDIIWHKPNPMPESVTDRCTKSHEYLFLLSKSERYYYDSEAIRESSSSVEQSVARRKRADFGSVGTKDLRGSEFGQSGKGMNGLCNGDFRNRRSVWTVPTQPYSGAHFATFPPALIEPCILAGCPAGGVVLDPFGGSGTTAEVAVSNGRKAVLIELNPEYIPLIRRRMSTVQPPLPGMAIMSNPIGESA